MKKSLSASDYLHHQFAFKQLANKSPVLEIKNAAKAS
jgi:hypothetical protein